MFATSIGGGAIWWTLTRYTAGMVFIAVKTVWSMPERFKVVCIPCKALYECSDLPLPPAWTLWIYGIMLGNKYAYHYCYKMSAWKTCKKLTSDFWRWFWQHCGLCFIALSIWHSLHVIVKDKFGEQYRLMIVILRTVVAYINSPMFLNRSRNIEAQSNKFLHMCTDVILWPVCNKLFLPLNDTAWFTLATFLLL